ncbi:MlaD family protein [Mycobacterium sp. Lab-001]|uniref:MlaD family protein n=1 Tax=Mycobacterium sp. Lab-001 TaxID=3410136 RepID=UPI003D169B52
MLIYGSEEAEKRTLTIVGAAVLICVAVAGLLAEFIPFGGRPAGVISFSIDTPYVGQGVAEGAAVVLHGVRVGEVTGVSSLPGGGVRVAAHLQKPLAAGLTDTMTIDFRPVNYFGVTGINLIPGAGGRPLRDGIRINTVPTGNFTLQALLSRLGEVSVGVLTPRLIQVIDRATRYTDALDPLIETALITADSVARVQTVSTARLLNNTAGLSVVFPSTVNALAGTGESLIHNDINFKHHSASDVSSDEFEHKYIPSLKLASEGLLADVGRLESTHLDDLLPVTEAVKALFDVVPPLIRPEGFAQLLGELRTRFEKMYAGPPDQRALKVRIVLDNLPGVAAPISAIGGP